MKTRFEAIHGGRPAVSTMRVSECTAYVLKLMQNKIGTIVAHFDPQTFVRFC